MGRCKGTVVARYSHWLATSTALTAKTAAQPPALPNGAPQATRDTPKGVQKPINVTELNRTSIFLNTEIGFILGLHEVI